MASELDIAMALTGRRRAEDGSYGRELSTTIVGVATSDSSDGSVRVDLGGESVTQDDVQEVEVPTTVEVREGDQVRVTLDGVPGSGRRPTVTGVVGGGDRTRIDVDNAVSDASQAVDTAATAKQSADAAVAETKDLVTLRIDSSRGTVFKNSEVSTVLTVRCYKRGAEITTREGLRDALGDQTARIRWWVLREGDESWVSLADSDHMLADDGFTLTITPADVDVKSTFKAEVVTD